MPKKTSNNLRVYVLRKDGSETKSNDFETTAIESVHLQVDSANRRLRELSDPQMRLANWPLYGSEDSLALFSAPAVERLSKDAKEAARTVSGREARYLVDAYYQLQDDRKRSDNQVRAAKALKEPTGAISWLSGQSRLLENRLKMMLDIFSSNNPLGVWARSNTGVGPVITAALLAHIDMAKAPTAGHIWSFAGLDGRTKWTSADKTKKEIESLIGKKSEVTYEDIVRVKEHFRRSMPTIEKYMDGNKSMNSLVKAIARKPWNTNLKVVCWKLGESFVKVSGKDDAFYGKLYVEYKVEEQNKNDRGEYAKQAAYTLQNTNIGKTTEAYEHYAKGKLPPAHLHSRAKRRAVKCS